MLEKYLDMSQQFHKCEVGGVRRGAVGCLLSKKNEHIYFLNVHNLVYCGLLLRLLTDPLPSMFEIPGEDGAVLQTPVSLIN